MLCLPVNAYCSRSICVLFIFIIESPFLLYYFILFILFLVQFFASLIKYRLFTWVGHEGGTVLLSGFAINWWQGWMAGWSRLRDLAHVKYLKIWLFIPTKWILIYACIKFTRTSMYVCIILSFIILMFNINRSAFLTGHQLFICIIWKLCWFLFTKWACFISMYKIFTVIFIYFKKLCLIVLYILYIATTLVGD